MKTPWMTLATTADLSFFRTIDKMHTQSISVSQIRAVKISSNSLLHNKTAFLSRRIDVERICQGACWFCWTSALLLICQGVLWFCWTSALLLICQGVLWFCWTSALLLISQGVLWFCWTSALL
jgi:hypothetical protein